MSIPYSVFPKARNKKKDIADIALQELKTMEAKKVMEKFDMVVYSVEDIRIINEALQQIREVLEKNTRKLHG